MIFGFNSSRLDTKWLQHIQLDVSFVFWDRPIKNQEYFERLDWNEVWIDVITQINDK